MDLQVLVGLAATVFTVYQHTTRVRTFAFFVWEEYPHGATNASFVWGNLPVQIGGHDANHGPGEDHDSAVHYSAGRQVGKRACMRFGVAAAGMPAFRFGEMPAAAARCLAGFGCGRVRRAYAGEGVRMNSS
jgi:hypothetical protein